MRFLEKKMAGAPLIARVAPFVIFLALTSGQGRFGPESAYWFYLAKTLAGAWMVYEMWPCVKEMRWAVSWEAVAAGVGVFALWIGITAAWTTQNALWAKFGWSTTATTWNPFIQFGAGSGMGWLFVVTRIVGSTLVVPPLEEVFYRSFLYRYIANPSFQTIPMNRFLPVPFLVAALVFGLSHNEWLSGILCGAVFQGLVLRKNRLGDAMTAHAITNFLLGAWVVWKGAWHFW